MTNTNTDKTFKRTHKRTETEQMKKIKTTTTKHKTTPKNKENEKTKQRTKNFDPTSFRKSSA